MQCGPTQPKCSGHSQRLPFLTVSAGHIWQRWPPAPALAAGSAAGLLVPLAQHRLQGPCTGGYDGRERQAPQQQAAAAAARRKALANRACNRVKVVSLTSRALTCVWRPLKQPRQSRAGRLGFCEGLAALQEC